MILWVLCGARRSPGAATLLAFCVGLGFTCTGPVALADSTDDNDLESSLQWDFSQDAASNRDNVLQVTHFVDDVHQVQLASGQSKTSAAEAGMETRSFLVGIEEISESRLNTGFTLERWGNPDVLVTESLRGLFRVNGEPISVTLSPQWRRIRIYDVTALRVLTASQAYNFDFDFYSRGLRALVSYVYENGWYLDVDALKQQYFANARLLQDRLETDECKPDLPGLALRTSPQTTTLGQSLEGRVYGFSTGLAREGWDFGLSWYVSQSALTGCESTQRSVKVGYEFHRQFSASFQFGEVNPDADDRFTFVSSSLTARW